MHMSLATIMLKYFVIWYFIGREKRRSLAWEFLVHEHRAEGFYNIQISYHVEHSHCPKTVINMSDMWLWSSGWMR